MARWRRALWGMHPARLLFAEYVLYLLGGWALLAWPASQKAPVAPLDNLFITTATLSSGSLSPADVGQNLS